MEDMQNKMADVKLKKWNNLRLREIPHCRKRGKHLQVGIYIEPNSAMNWGNLRSDEGVTHTVQKRGTVKH